MTLRAEHQVCDFTARRVITGHDSNGKSMVLSDGTSPLIFTSPSLPGYISHDIFRTFSSPATIAAQTPETTSGPRRQLPTPSGTVIRVSQVPPGGARAEIKPGTASASAAFAALGNLADHTGNDASAKSALMHRTETIDYVFVVAGELTLILDNEDVVLNAGDFLVQCGTNHAWENRTNSPVTVIFILNSGVRDSELTQLLEKSS